jgi:hypothetical protein
MIDGATGNLVYTSVNPPPPGADPITWSGFTGTNSNGGGYSGGYIPGYNSNTGTFMFGYAQGTIAYSTPVNYALSMAGTNIQVNGFKYSWEYFNQDYSRGTLSGNINLTNKNGQIVENYNYNMPQTTSGWTTMSGIENFSTQYSASTIDRLNVSFTGKDDRWWAGYYGPQIRDIDVKLLYSVAPPPVPTDFSKWVPLTNENGDFTLTKSGVVRYGANDTYVYHEFQAGTYSCSNSAWGTDPIGGVYKSCSLGTNTTTTTTVPKTTTTTDTFTVLLDPVTTVASPTSTTAITPTTIVTEPVTGTTTTSTAPASQPSVVASVVSAPAPTATTSSSTASSSSSTTSSSSQTTKETSGSSGNVSLALSIIGKNSERDAAGSAVAQAAVAQAQATATQAQQDAATVAASAVANSITVNAATGGGQQANGSGTRTNQSTNSTNFSLQSGVASVASVTIGPQSPTQMFGQQQSTGTGINILNNQPVITSTNTQPSFYESSSVIALLQPQTAAMFVPNTVAPTEQQTQTMQSTQTNTNTSTQSTETYALVTPNMLTDKTNPLTDIIEVKQTIPQTSTIAMSGPVVNKNTQDNDVAGGVSIAKMAIDPAGYNSYLNIALRDVAFYAPKEVYKNQRNVDNARALRLMTNDSKHKEMMEMQYAK